MPPACQSTKWIGPHLVRIGGRAQQRHEPRLRQAGISPLDLDRLFNKSGDRADGGGSANGRSNVLDSPAAPPSRPGRLSFYAQIGCRSACKEFDSLPFREATRRRRTTAKSRCSREGISCRQRRLPLHGIGRDPPVSALVAGVRADRPSECLGCARSAFARAAQALIPSDIPRPEPDPGGMEAA